LNGRWHPPIEDGIGAPSHAGLVGPPSRDGRPV